MVDADVHSAPVPLPGGSITADDLLRVMHRAGVDKALTWLQPPYLRQLEESHAYVHESARAPVDGWRAAPACTCAARMTCIPDPATSFGARERCSRFFEQKRSFKS